MMNRTITIKKSTLRNFILSFFLGFSLLFGIEHFGTFSYKIDYENIEIGLIEREPFLLATL